MKKNTDTTALNDKFIERLKKDATFNAIFSNQVASFEQQIGVKNAITLDSLTTMASKFFYASKYTPEGDIHWNVCVGKNGYRNHINNDLALMEAFCFQTVIAHLQDTVYNINEDYSHARESIDGSKVPGSDDVKLAYVRDEMYKRMRASSHLSDLLFHTYMENSAQWSFIIK